MIHIKNNSDIEKMRAGGKILAEVLQMVISHIKPGVTELELDALAEKLIREKGGEPGFKKVKGYRHTICATTNDVVVHGIPSSYAYKAGDVAGVDCGVFYEGFHTDMAETILVSNQKSPLRQGSVGQAKVKSEEDKIDKFLETGKRALEAAIKQAKPGNRVGHISKTIQDIVELNASYGVVRSLVGHGVGRALHEEPEVPGFLMDPLLKTPLLRAGMTIAIEVIYNMGSNEVGYKGSDGWTIASKDGSVSGVFERTVLITDKGNEVLTA